ncbi:MAG: LLM class flavin-dependent oxidoreductase [Acidimicrobiales bacterium]|jgi:alkanesulfonate monooxygenase SsuD/methylene tetrahydromethanopterin reductase-like flavin-dependent oxidoreductase (luciferase family)
MTPSRVPLGVLDLVPLTSGSDPSTALRNTVDLLRTVEALGYSRYWFAEHHLNPGVAGSSPAVLIALVAAATKRIRLGSGGVQSGHRTALSVVEEFGLLEAMHPGRIDLGIGRSGGRNFLRDRLAAAAKNGAGDKTPGVEARRSANGLLIPSSPSLAGLANSPRLALTAELLQQQGAESAAYGDLLRDVVGLLRGSYRSPDGLDPHPRPGAGADVELWVLGSSAGESATVAGELGLRFAASYHISPSTALEAIDAYRAAFRASPDLDRPYVAMSADVVVGPDDESARELATGYGLWVRSIRKGEGAMPFPSPDEARPHRWSDEDRALVRDRVETQFVGSPQTVATRLEQLREATDADELVVTTVTHRHQDRVRSFGLLATEWFNTDPPGRPGRGSDARAGASSRDVRS